MGLDRDSICFFRVRWCRTVFWICAGNSVDNRHVFITAEQYFHSLRPILLFIPPVKGWRGHKVSGGDTEQLTQGIFHAVWNHTRPIELEEVGDIQSDGVCLPESPSHAGARLPWGWLSTCLPWGGVKELPALLCLCGGFCFTCQTAFISASSFLTFPFPVLSPSHWEE